jgi:tetratricopeptide (TPR) repeat protein
MSLVGNAQRSNKQIIYDSFLKGDMATWKQTVDKMLLEKVQNNDFKFEVLNYLYGYIGWCLGNDKKKEARTYLDKAEVILKDLETRKINLSLVNAYHSAFNGFNIALDLYKMIIFGSRSIKHADQALALDPNNYFAYLQVGNIEFHKPATFGGDKYKAINNYGKAQKLIENQYFKTKNDWNYLSILVSIARTYSELGKLQEAKKYYEAILKIEPNFEWVKNKLLPELNKKIKNGK